jgi:hypothetical protein
VDFPSSPVLNQIYTFGDKTWKWNGVAWLIQASALTAFTNTFTGTGAQTAFTMTQSVISVNDISVTVNGLDQLPTTHYTVSGTTLTFVVAPQNGSNIMVRRTGGTTGATGPAALVPIELAVSAIGRPSAGQVLARYIATRAATFDQSLCRGSARVASTATVAVTVKKNGSSIATFTFAASATATVSVSNTALVAGDIITFEAPASQDSTLEDIAVTLAGQR